MKGRPLSAYDPWLTAANVRGRIDPARMRVVPGCGGPGDLVLGVVEPSPGAGFELLDSARKLHRLEGPHRVLAVLGPRDSSTHVCATLPAEGLLVEDGTRADWVAGESGIVGCLERAPASSRVHRPETALPFRCAGLLADADGIVNIQRFAVRPRLPRLDLPIVMVAATSSEAGKTILAGELIARLTMRGQRVAAIKVTGTGGVMDSLHHASSGAIATFDQVDAGLITTHGSAGDVRARIPALFRSAQECHPDVILAELGGDLVSANNPALFELPELVDRTVLLLVIANDALAASGVAALNDTRLHYPRERIRFLSSPFRNHVGMVRRMAAVGIEPVFDPCSATDLDRLAREIHSSLADSATPAAPAGGIRRLEQAG